MHRREYGELSINAFTTPAILFDENVRVDTMRIKEVDVIGTKTLQACIQSQLVITGQFAFPAWLLLETRIGDLH